MWKAILFALSLAAVAAASADYSDGYCAGYKAGWCYGSNFCIEPICPIAPIPELGRDSYQDGYNRGFLAGIAAKHR